MPLITQLPSVVIDMEVCGGAHCWARCFREHGHVVKVMAPQFVKPYVKANKHDMADAEAIGAAVTRPTMHFVPIKALAQQDFQALHRLRERLVKARTALHGARATLRWNQLKHDPRRQEVSVPRLHDEAPIEPWSRSRTKTRGLPGGLLTTDQVYMPAYRRA